MSLCLLMKRIGHRASVRFHAPWATLAPAPSLVIIEVTNRCNLRCRMCYRENLRETGDMDFPTFKSVVDQLAVPGTRIALGGVGEPFLHPDLFLMLQYCIDRGFPSVVTITNGTLLDARLAEFAGMKLSELKVSIDGSDRETYERIRLGADFEKVIGNLRLFKRETTIPLTVTAVVMPDNLESIWFIPELAASMGENIHIHLQTAFEYTQFVKGQGGLTEAGLGVIEEVAEKCRRLNLGFGFNNYTGRKLCTQIFTDAFIDFKGFLTPCCILPDKRLDSVVEHGFSTVWNGNRMRAWRKAILAGRYPEECRRLCHVGEGANAL